MTDHILGVGIWGFKDKQCYLNLSFSFNITIQSSVKQPNLHVVKDRKFNAFQISTN